VDATSPLQALQLLLPNDDGSVIYPQWRQRRSGIQFPSCLCGGGGGKPKRKSFSNEAAPQRLGFVFGFLARTKLLTLHLTAAAARSWKSGEKKYFLVRKMSLSHGNFSFVHLEPGTSYL
jgi:hypothetical protein